MKRLILLASLVLFSFFSLIDNHKEQPYLANSDRTLSLSCPDYLPPKLNINETTDINKSDTATGNISNDWYAQAVKNIRQEEYNISFCEETGAIQSPNRANNIHFTYQKNGFTAKTMQTNVPLFDVNDRSISENYKKYKELEAWSVELNIKNYELGIKNSELTYDRNKACVENDKIRIDYVNSGEGMRQDFVIKENTSGEDGIELQLKVNTKLKMNVSKDAVTFFSKKDGAEKMQYSSLKVWDANGKMLDAYFEKRGAEDFAIVVEDKDAVYPVTIDPLSNTPDWEFEGNNLNAKLGFSVSSAGDVNGDGYDDVIIGSLNYTCSWGSEGKAFLFYGSAMGLSPYPVWTYCGTYYDDHLGQDVSSAGDVNNDGYDDILIAHQRPNTWNNWGVYSFYGSASGLATSPNWLVNLGNGDLGRVTGAGDVNGDGFDDIIIADGINRFLEYNGSASGIASEANWSYNEGYPIWAWCKAIASAGDVNNDGFDDIIINGSKLFFGSASGLSLNPDWFNPGNGPVGNCAGDVNADGFDDVIIGTWEYNDHKGKVTVHYGSSSGISYEANWVAFGNQSWESFGLSVASAGDINADGFSDVLIGAPNFVNNSADTGRVHVFYGSSSGLQNSGKQVLTCDQYNAHFGVSVSSAGDVNGDGCSDIVVGADVYSNVESDEGKAFVFYGARDQNEIFADLTFKGENPFDFFGVCTNPAGDVNDDGYDDYIIGAPDYNLKTGRAYLYFGSSSPDSIPDIIFNGEISWYPFFGNSASGAGDLNGDGYDDIIIGAYGYSGVNGRAYIFYGGASMDNIPDLILEGEQLFNDFGMQVAKAGDVNGDIYPDVIVGARGYNNWTGRAYIYFGGTGMDNIPDIIMTGEAAGDQFGCAVTSAGDYNADGYSDVIVGAYRFGNNTGRAYLYLGGSSMNNVSDMVMTGEGIDNNFGSYAASAGDVNNDGYSDIAIGADEWSHSTNKVYIYFGANTPDNTADLVLNGENAGDHFAPVFNNDDFNEDSYSDVFIGAWGYNNREGKAYLFNGGLGMNTIADMFMTGEETGGMFGSYLSSAGDINGDGYPDLIVGAHAYQNNTGKAYLYFGSGDPEKTISELTVSPDVSIKQIHDQVCINGNIKNILNQPVFNIRINYFIKGVNDGYGNGFSNSSGNVQFCYTGTSPGIDTIIAVSGKLRDTAFVFWESQSSCIVGPDYVIRNSANLYFTELSSDIYWDISNFESTQATIISDNHNDSLYVNSGNNFGHFVLYLVTPDSTLCTKHVYVDNPTPVEISAFNSSVSGRDVSLLWSTSSEINNSGFEIEKSNVKGQMSDEWSMVGFVPGNGTSTEIHNYAFTEKGLNTGKYNFRLKQIDYNGNFEYFELAEEVVIGIPLKYNLSQNYPNPFNPVTTINYDLPDDGIVNIRLYDILGREMQSLVNEMKTAGYYKLQFNAADLSSGVYFYRMTTEDFVAVKKFVVLK